MSDEALRAAERRFRATGAHMDEVAWLMARPSAVRDQARDLSLEPEVVEQVVRAPLVLWLLV